MRLILLFTILLLWKNGFSQPKSPSANPFIPEINIDSSDMFELPYSKYSHSHYCDTLPIYRNDYEESQALRNLQTVIYFPDTLNIKVIEFRDGNRGTYYFFFDGPYLVKARFYDSKNNKSRSYRYTKKESTGGKIFKQSEILKGIINQDKETVLSTALGLKKS
jgi:hypothetical protein